MTSPVSWSFTTDASSSNGTNLALSGTAYRWNGMTSATATTNQTKAPALNDGNLTKSINLGPGGADHANAYEGAGVIWTTAQSISKVTFTNGNYTTSQDGVFDANFGLQVTTDGKTWQSVTGWSLDTPYAYNSANAGGATYTFTGPSQSVLGFRVVGQVHTSATGVNSWYDRASEVQAFGSSSSSSGGSGSTNLALTGTAYRWSGLTSNTSNSNRASAPGLNDNNLTNNVDLSGQGGDVPNAYEGAGVLWSTAQAVSKVVFVNGSYTASQDGVFDAGFTLQFTTDGTTWTNATNWTLSSAYAYNSPSAGGATYTFTGPTTNVLGFRVVGQVYTSATGVNSWYDQASEVQAF
jgi:hypothetical protein